MSAAIGVLNLIAWYCARFWHWIWRKQKWQRVFLVRRIEDEPDQYQPGILYVVEDTGVPWAAAMACPCGCGNSLHMNLLPDTKPVWSLKIERDGAPTLTPSVWRQEGCHSHFFLRRGHIKWV
jgi:hypothetical protein